jgi:hypothetical protein
MLLPEATMKDADFKALPHYVEARSKITRGTAVSEGYKPDVTVRDTDGCLRFILECEQKPDRKAFLGDFLKAELFASECQTRPTLIIVMHPYPNTTVAQIANQIRRYARWLAKAKNGLHLKNILVLSDQEYLESHKAGEAIGSEQFLARGTSAI